MSERTPDAALAKLLARAALAYAAAGRGLARLLEQGTVGLEGMLTGGLTSTEREALSIVIYRQQKPRQSRRALFDWERSLFEQQLPRPPARILLGGAGNGAEALPLRAAGYEVHAFEPATSCLPLLSAAVGPCGSASELSYQQLLARTRSASQLLSRRYHAVILGWGSIHHVLDPRTRLALVKQCAQLCPDGPILLSFALCSETEPLRQSRAFELGARLGRRLGQLRRLPQPEAAELERFWLHAGFVHMLTHSELRALAAATGRDLHLYTGPYAHAALSPKPAAAPRP